MFAVSLLVGAHTLVIDAIDGADDPGKILIRDSSNILLATIPLDTPCGAVDPTTGRLTFAIAGRDESPPASGQAATAVFCDGDDEPYVTVPCRQGTSPLPGYLTLHSNFIEAGVPFEVQSFTLG